MTEMKDDRRQRGAGAILIGVVLVSMLYVLSYGPAEWLVKKAICPQTLKVWSIVR